MTGTQVSVGIDLALRSKHTAVAKIAGQETFYRLPPFDPRTDQLQDLVDRVRHLAGADAGMEFVMEPTSSAWFPVARWLKLRGFAVYLVRTEKVADLRRYLRKHTKTDTIDAKTLASISRYEGDALFPARFQSTDQLACWRLCQQRARSARQVSSIKTRVRDFLELAVPGLHAVLNDPFTRMGRKLISRHLNPHRTAALGWARFRKFCQQAHRGPAALEHWEKIYAVFVAASHLYEATQEAEDIAVDFDLLQEEIAAELELLRFHEDRIQKLEAKIPVYYQKIDPHKILTSITGIGPTIGAAVTARVGNIADFPNLKGFRSYCGYVPRKKQTSKTDRKGMPITKAANNLLKSYLYMAAETARHWDPQFADFYDRLVFVQKKHHNAAMAALANKMVGRIYGVLRRAADPKPQQPAAYQLRDLQGQPISKAQARELALEIASRRKHKEERSSGTA